jgi:hypothetical protein
MRAVSDSSDSKPADESLIFVETPRETEDERREPD